MIAGERDGYGLPAVVRGDTDSRKPELSVDLVHQWVIHQACTEGRAEQDRKVKIQFAECGVSIEVPIAPTVAASLLGVVTIVLLGVIGYQWRLLRLARLDRIRNSGSAEARGPNLAPFGDSCRLSSPDCRGTPTTTTTTTSTTAAPTTTSTTTAPATTPS